MIGVSIHYCDYLLVRFQAVLLDIVLHLLRTHILHDGPDLVGVAVPPENNRLEEDLHENLHTKPAMTQPRDHMSSEYP